MVGAPELVYWAIPVTKVLGVSRFELANRPVALPSATIADRIVALILFVHDVFLLDDYFVRN